MTSYNFPDSASVAMKFAIKLLCGTLNIHPDWFSDSAMIETYRVVLGFSTDIMKHLRVHLYDYELSKLHLTDIEKNPNGFGSDSEIRNATLFAKDRHGNVVEVATFDVERDLLDGEHAAGWTRWQVKHVKVSLGGTKIALHSEPVERTDPELIWGQIV